MIYSDFYLNGTTKIEVLPTDSLNQETAVFEPGDRLICVFRPLGGEFIAKMLNKFFVTDLRSRYIDEEQPILEALKATVHACNLSFLTPSREGETLPEAGAMLLVVYITPKNTANFVQLGSVTMKQKVDGKFRPVTEDQTFNNSKEISNMTATQFFRDHSDPAKAEEVIKSVGKSISITEVENIPSRFLGHPSWCSLGGEYGETIASTIPFMSTVQI